MTIYQPEEDSYLLSEEVKKIISESTPKTILDMGSGSGIQAETALNSRIENKNIFCVDINLEAIAHLKNKFQNTIQSNLFESVPEQKFDLIIFNPPYLPADKDEPRESQRETTGGKKGSEIINKFLKQAKGYLSPNGKILLLTSSLTKDIDFSGYEKKILAKKKIFFEELVVLELEIRKL